MDVVLFQQTGNPQGIRSIHRRSYASVRCQGERLPYCPMARWRRQWAKCCARRNWAVFMAPQRVHMPLGGSGTLLLMPAADDAVAVTKIVSVHPENAASRLPCVQGEVLVMRTEDGERFGLLDGRVLTQRRTAAISLFAAQKLMPRGNDATEMLVFGAGAQAHGHVEAFVRGNGACGVCASYHVRA